MKVSAVISGLVLAGAVLVAGNQAAHAQVPTDPAQPSAAPVVKKEVEVKPGDILSRIATDHGTTYVRLFDANENIKDPDIIYPGDKIRIPAADEQLGSRTIPAEVPVVTATPAPSQAQAPSAPRQRAAANPQPRAASAAAHSGDVWDRLAQCESGGNWSINTGNGYYGGLQFTPSSWRAAGGSGMPHQASREEQIERGKRLQSIQGWGAWPACTRKLGIR